MTNATAAASQDPLPNPQRPIPASALTVAQAARAAGIPLREAYFRIQHRSLGSKVDGKWRLSPADVARLAVSGGGSHEAQPRPRS